MKRKGFTLLELMVSASVALVLVAAATAVMISVIQQKKTNTNNLETQVALVSGTSALEFDLLSVGYRLAVPAYGVRTLDGLVAGTNLSSGGDSLECGVTASDQFLDQNSQWVPVPGSDVIEMSYGYSGRSPGTVYKILPSWLASATFPATVSPLNSNDFMNTNPPIKFQLDVKDNLAPFLDSEFNLPAPNLRDDLTGVPILVFEDATTSCAMAVRQLAPGGIVSGYYLTTDYQNPGATGPPPVSALQVTKPCPAVGMTVYRLEKRVRYILCATASKPQNGKLIRREINGGNPPLFRDNGPNGGHAAAFKKRSDNLSELYPTIVQEKVADLQFAPMFSFTAVTAPYLATFVGPLSALDYACTNNSRVEKLPNKMCIFGEKIGVLALQSSSGFAPPAAPGPLDFFAIPGSTVVTGHDALFDYRYWVKGMKYGITTIAASKDSSTILTTGDGQLLNSPVLFLPNYKTRNAVRQVRFDNFSVVK